MLYVLIALLLFGVLIAVHEFGHFAAAKVLGVRVNEFSVGMGPAIFKRQWGRTVYALRVLPVGGYCAMEGEDEESDDPRAFGAQAAWKRIIILCAGAFMNFITGFVLILLLFSGAQAFSTTQIAGFADGFPLQAEQGLMVGDRILRINGERTRLYSDVTTMLSRGHGAPFDIVLERAGETITLNDLPLAPREYTHNGQTTMRYGVDFAVEEATFGRKLANSWYNALSFVRLVRMSLADLISGAAGVKDLSGPIGIVNTIAGVGSQSETPLIALENILYFGALIAVNLAVMNLLPLPALDGGRVFFLVVNQVWFFLTRRRINPRYEGYVHLAGLAALLALMAVVSFNDIVRILQH